MSARNVERRPQTRHFVDQFMPYRWQANITMVTLGASTAEISRGAEAPRRNSHVQVLEMLILSLYIEKSLRRPFTLMP